MRISNLALRGSSLCALTAVCLLLIFGAKSVWGAAGGGAVNDELIPVTFQLRWHHQFQFAGYYAAVEKGFYREAGFDVNIVEGRPGRTPVGEVLAGRATYGEANSELLYARLNGKPLVALAAVFQHSPSVLLVKRSSGITSPQDLVGRRVMMVGGTDDVDFMAMFRNEGIDPRQLQIQESSYDLLDLVNGRTDAFNAYLTNEPYLLAKLGIDGSIINPRTYGIDFYSDILFTTEREVKEHPEEVRAFRRASLRGWEYAMEHPEEVVRWLVGKYHTKKTEEHLHFEAAMMRGLIMPDLIQIGHMNPGRWKHMADIFVEQKMVATGYDLRGFIYDPEHRPDYGWMVRGFKIALPVTFAALALTLLLMVFNRRLQAEIRVRQQAEAEIRRLAHYDVLTGLPNRALYHDRLDQAIAKVKRDNSVLAVLFLDLDGFKQVNDSAGHEVGDDLLKTVARKLEDTVREVDTVGRIGGDEFVIVLEELTQAADAEVAAEKIIKAISAVYCEGCGSFPVSGSIGVALYPQHGRDVQTLIKHADTAMYAAKRSGKRRIAVYAADAPHDAGTPEPPSSPDCVKDTS